MVSYDVVFEKYKGAYYIVGICNNPQAKDNMCDVVASKGKDHAAISITYKTNTAMGQYAIIVYTQKGDKDSTRPTFQKMRIAGKMPTVDDLFVYKLENSAKKRVNDLNAAWTKEAVQNGVQNECTARLVNVEMNVIY